jgi:hypothetical protein
MVTALNPSKVAEPFAWDTPVNVPAAVTCLDVMETA